MPSALPGWRTVWTLCRDRTHGNGKLWSLLCLYLELCGWKMVLLQWLQSLQGEKHCLNCFFTWISLMEPILSPGWQESCRSRLAALSGAFSSWKPYFVGSSVHGPLTLLSTFYGATGLVSWGFMLGGCLTQICLFTHFRYPGKTSSVPLEIIMTVGKRGVRWWKRFELYRDGVLGTGWNTDDVLVTVEPRLSKIRLEIFLQCRYQQC